MALLIHSSSITTPYGFGTGGATSTAAGATDAFGRIRTAAPLTLFDSSHRYSDNGLWATSTASGGTSTFDANAGLVNLAVTTTSGSEVIRETTKCFSYQPGKSLLVMSTFTLAAAKTGLRQRVGYYGASNGMYLELANTDLALVERSSSTGSLAETRVLQSNWNIDPLDGTGPSNLTLDITKSQILWMDIEWLGLGTVRLGFVINGKFIHCHSFHHANIITETYITTASLPLRYEITNTVATASNSTLKQVCSTVISEGGYELRGLQQAIGTTITTPYALATAGTYYPIISLRLKSTRLDAIVILTAVSIMAASANTNYNWRVVASPTTTGGTWTNTSDVNLKSDITPVNGTDLLAKIKQLEITRWRYNGTNEYHIGPMAQQFYQLFQTGVDDKGISTVDPAGIALKGIQEQQKQIEALRAENEQLKQAIQELKQMIIQKPAVNGN
jgi:hypothetical protein